MQSAFSVYDSPRASVPRLFNLGNTEDDKEFRALCESGEIRQTVDEYQVQLRELFAIDNPSLALSPDFEAKFETFLSSIDSSAPFNQQGIWAYFPWLFMAVHILPDSEYQRVRTARNRNLITEEEQRKFYSTVIGIAGLSVGNSVALAITLQGGARTIKLADHDRLELSNLNRIRAGVDSLGIRKVELAARQIYLLNPYAKVLLFPEGLTEDTIGNFFSDVDIVIDEIDSLPMKFRLREEAKKRKVPLLMAADNDRSGVIDIERYDLDPQLEFFHGRLNGDTQKSLVSLDKQEVGRKIAKLIGIENHTERMFYSLTEMGKSIPSWPQLGGTALLNGSAIAYCALKIANNEPLVRDRVIIDLDPLFDPEYYSEKNVTRRTDLIGTIKKILGL